MKTYHEKAKGNKYPEYICPNCGYKTKLTFNIKKKYKRWEAFVCPNCGEARLKFILDNRLMI